MKAYIALHTWNLTRVLRIATGVFFFAMGIVDGPWLASAAGLVLMYQGLFNTGCGLVPGSNSCTIPFDSSKKAANP